MNGGLNELVASTKLLVGVCGTVAAMGTPHALLWARATLGVVRTRAILSPMAVRMVGKMGFEAALDGPVVTEWSDLEPCAAPHVRLANWPDVILVLPASANLLGKMAGGIADSLLTTVLLAATCPVVLAPAMNAAMWTKPAVQRNVKRLREDGYTIIEPGVGLSLANNSKDEAGSIEDVRKPFIIALSMVISDLGPITDFTAAPAPGQETL